MAHSVKQNTHWCCPYIQNDGTWTQKNGLWKLINQSNEMLFWVKIFLYLMVVPGWKATPFLLEIFLHTISMWIWVSLVPSSEIFEACVWRTKSCIDFHKCIFFFPICLLSFKRYLQILPDLVTKFVFSRFWTNTLFQVSF